MLQSLSRSPRELGSLAQLEDYTILYCTVLYCTVLYCTALYCTVLYCTVLYCTVLYCTVLYCTVLWCTVLYCTVLYCTVLYSTVLYCTVLYCTVLYCTVLYCTILYCTVLYCTAPYCTVPYCTVPYCTVLYCTVPYCTLWHCHILSSHCVLTLCKDIVSRHCVCKFNVSIMLLGFKSKGVGSRGPEGARSRRPLGAVPSSLTIFCFPNEIEPGAKLKCLPWCLVPRTIFSIIWPLVSNISHFTYDRLHHWLVYTDWNTLSPSIAVEPMAFHSRIVSSLGQDTLCVP